MLQGIIFDWHKTLAYIDQKRYVLYPESREILQFTSCHVPVFLLSGEDEFLLQMSMKELKLNDIFTQILGNSQKPCVDLRFILQKYHLDLTQVWFVGDSLSQDMECAIKNNLQGVYLYNRRLLSIKEMEFIHKNNIKAFSDLKDLLITLKMKLYSKCP